MSCWIGLKALPAMNRPVNLLGRHGPFFHNSVGDDRCDRPMEKVQDPELYVLPTDPKFVNAVPQVIGLRAAKLVPQFAQPLQPEEAFRLRFDRQLAVPVEKRAGAIFLAVQNDSGPWHSPLVYSQNCDIATRGRCG